MAAPRLVSLLLVCLAGFAAGAADAQPTRLWTLFTGQAKCLDVVNDAARDKLLMANCDRYAGQAWELRPAEGARGRVRIGNAFSGAAMCLDVLKDAADDTPVMAACNGSASQTWRVEDLGDGYFSLGNDFTGPGKCLDVLDDERDERLVLTDCGRYSGQMWSTRPAG